MPVRGVVCRAPALADLARGVPVAVAPESPLGRQPAVESIAEALTVASAPALAMADGATADGLGSVLLRSPA